MCIFPKLTHSLLAPSKVCVFKAIIKFLTLKHILVTTDLVLMVLRPMLKIFHVNRRLLLGEVRIGICIPCKTEVRALSLARRCAYKHGVR